MPGVCFKRDSYLKEGISYPFDMAVDSRFANNLPVIDINLRLTLPLECDAFASKKCKPSTINLEYKTIILLALIYDIIKADKPKEK